MKPLLSVIIPMYGVEKFISKCLDSVISQSYTNMEILCVNDGTKDRSAEIAAEYAKKDSRVRVINNPQNLGLFRARVEGLKQARGEYIAFVDADDYISIDWYRLLVKKAVSEDADIVIGNTINVDENGHAYYYNNYRKLTTSHKSIIGEDILKTLYDQEGACFVWHTVWNKVYSARLIKKCMHYLEKVDFHMIMGEDIAFSSVFFTHAQKLCFANVDCYFYYRHSEASTSLSLPKEKIIKNILDLGTVFNFAEECLKEYSTTLYEKHQPLIANFKNRYQRIWRGNIWNAKINDDPLALDAMEKTFGVRDGELPKPHDFYFYEMTTGWSNSYENIKRAIVDPKTPVISFDIFDTLILRPFAKPTDLFAIVGKNASEKIPFINEKNFSKMRIQAEVAARDLSEEDDITLTDIYDTFASIYGISKEEANLLKQEEEKAELKYCYARSAAKELFDLAIDAEKRIIITSDMYLEKSFVEKLLHDNGYIGYEQLFISSDTKLLKANGKIYDYIVKLLEINPDDILHIGDNWNSDIVAAEKKGLKAMFLPKCTETFENGISNIYAGTGALPFRKRLYIPEDTSASMSSLPISTAYATLANMLFDNPFEHFQEESSFNGDSYYMGAYGLGMHTLGIAQWIYNEAKRNGYKKIVFLARDGKMLKEIFDHLCEKKGAKIETDYFYATRKALMPYSIKCAKDFYKLDSIIDIRKHTPENIISMFSSILNPLNDEAREEYKKRNVNLDEYLPSDKEYFNFVRALIEISYNEQKAKAGYEIASFAFKKVFTENCAAFDIGYSGRLQSIICDLADRPIDVFYIHSNGYNTQCESKHKFKIHTFYDYTPNITGIVREYFISAPEPSCIAYHIENDVVYPIVEETGENLAYDAVFAINEMQNGAIAFCKKYLDFFADMPDNFVARNSDYSIAFDFMLLAAKEFDRYTFVNSAIEDEVYSGYSRANLFDVWTWHLSVLESNPYSTASGSCSIIPSGSDVIFIGGTGKFKKAIAYLLFDRYTLKTKFKQKFKKHKAFLAVCGFFYRIPRFFYRLFKKSPKK